MNEDQKRPWFSWSPNMPKPAILALALLCNLNILGFGYYNAWEEIKTALTAFPDLAGVPAETLTQFGLASGKLLLTLLAAEAKELMDGPPIARFTGMAVLLQLNLEAIYMLLTMRRNHWEKEQAVAKAKAEAKAEGQDQANAAARAWYEAWQKNPAAAPPPPFLNGKNGDSGYAL